MIDKAYGRKALYQFLTVQGLRVQGTPNRRRLLRRGAPIGAGEEVQIWRDWHAYREETWAKGPQWVQLWAHLPEEESFRCFVEKSGFSFVGDIARPQTWDCRHFAFPPQMADESTPAQVDGDIEARREDAREQAAQLHQSWRLFWNSEIARTARIAKQLDLKLRMHAGLGSFARDIGRAARLRQIYDELQSAKVAKEQAKWLDDVRSLAGDLAAVLDTLSNNAVLDLEMRFNCSKFNSYGLLSPLELKPMLEELSQAAKAAVAGKPTCCPPISKTVGRSAAERFIIKLADAWEKHTDEKLRPQRIDKEGRKGGKFCDFVDKVAREWGHPKPPRADSVAGALRTRTAGMIEKEISH